MKIIKEYELNGIKTVLVTKGSYGYFIDPFYLPQYDNGFYADKKRALEVAAAYHNQTIKTR
jgi:hypothetical protein